MCKRIKRPYFLMTLNGVSLSCAAFKKFNFWISLSVCLKETYLKVKFWLLRFYIMFLIKLILSWFSYFSINTNTWSLKVLMLRPKEVPFVWVIKFLTILLWTYLPFCGHYLRSYYFLLVLLSLFPSFGKSDLIVFQNFLFFVTELINLLEKKVFLGILHKRFTP